MSSLSLPIAGWVPGGGELLIILFIILLLFGGSKLPALAKGLGQSVKEFKKAANETDDDKDAKKPSDGNDASKLRNN